MIWVYNGERQRWVKILLNRHKFHHRMSPCRKKKIPKVKELTEFNEIFSVDILMNNRYNAPVILFETLLHFFRSVNLNHVSLRHNTDSQRYVIQG